MVNMPEKSSLRRSKVEYLRQSSSFLHVCKVQKPMSVGHSARKCPLKAPLNALSVGLSGLEKSSATPRGKPADPNHVRQLSALVDPDRCRRSHFSPGSFPHRDDIRAAEAELSNGFQI